MINANSGQDWNTVVFTKKKPTAGQQRSTQSVNQARRAGAEVATMKKFSGGSNASEASRNAARLDEDTEARRQAVVPTEIRKIIMQGRQAKKLSQKELGNLINEPPKTIQEYENGKAVPSNQVLGKLERALGVKLRGGKKKKGKK